LDFRRLETAPGDDGKDFPSSYQRRGTRDKTGEGTEYGEFWYDSGYRR
jgi:hypothetical protein